MAGKKSTHKVRRDRRGNCNCDSPDNWSIRIREMGVSNVDEIILYIRRFEQSDFRPTGKISPSSSIKAFSADACDGLVPLGGYGPSLSLFQ
jgi:hypothetical protein